MDGSKRQSLRKMLAGCLTLVSIQAFFPPGVAGDERIPAVDQQPPTETASIPPTSPQASQAAIKETRLSQEATTFIKGMALILLPDTFTDDDDWGAHKRIQSGLNVDVDGLKLKTSRRWKEVNHGTWQRVDAVLVDPQHHFDLQISVLPRLEGANPRYRVRAKIRIRATGRQQQWNLGARLYSLSADAIADVSVTAVVRFDSQVIKSDDGSKLRVLPYFESVNAELESFSLRRLSHAKGAAIREFGKVVEVIVQKAIQKKNRKLTTKTNGKIRKKPERFEIPAGILSIFGESPQPQ